MSGRGAGRRPARVDGIVGGLADALERGRLRPREEGDRAAGEGGRRLRREQGIDEADIEWLMSNNERELGGLNTLLDRLDREWLAAKRRFTVPFLRQVLEEGRPRY